MDDQRSPLAKHWCFTINNPTATDVIASGFDYLVTGNEIGENGTPHVQGYVVFTQRKRLTAVKKILRRAHWEIARGTPEENRTYCTKDGDFGEWGTLPLTGSETVKRNFDEAFTLAQLGRLDDIPGNLRVPYYNTFKRIQLDYSCSLPANPTTCGVWLWGPTGTGKSRSARWLFPGAFPKMANKWWDGFKGERFVLIEDLDPVHSVLAHHLKLWADHYEFLAEMKGTAIRIRPEIICVTSNYSIDAIFNPADASALNRRFVTHMF